MDLLTSLNRDHDISIAMVTHEPEMAAHATRVVYLVDGRGDGVMRPGESS